MDSTSPGSLARDSPYRKRIFFKKATAQNTLINNKRTKETTRYPISCHTGDGVLAGAPTPPPLSVRGIANEINMTERSVQIWFQEQVSSLFIQPSIRISNNMTDVPRSNIARKSIENGEDCEHS